MGDKHKGGATRGTRRSDWGLAVEYWPKAWWSVYEKRSMGEGGGGGGGVEVAVLTCNTLLLM